MSAYIILLALYGCEGLFYASVIAMPAVLFQNLHQPIEWITYWTGLLALPWTLKVLAAPTVDRARNLRAPLISCLGVCVCACFSVTMLLHFRCATNALLLALGVLGCVAALLENFVDRIYMSVWTRDQQTRLMWFRNTAFRVTYLFGAGFIVAAAGYLNESLRGDDAHYGWTVAFAFDTVLCLLGMLGAIKFLPASTSFVEAEGTEPTLTEALLSFLRIKNLWKFLIYLSVFRIGDAVLSCVAQPFLLMDSAHGGMALKTSQVGFLYGTLGSISLILGGIAGGVAISKFGVRPLLIPFSLLQSGAVASYYALAIYKPDFVWVGLTNSFEQFTFGLTTACYSVVMLATVQPRHKATHYGLTCAFVNLGLLVPSMYSGTLVEQLGYANFFALSAVLSLLGPMVSVLLPSVSHEHSLLN